MSLFLLGKEEIFIGTPSSVKFLLQKITSTVNTSNYEAQFNVAIITNKNDDKQNVYFKVIQKQRKNLSLKYQNIIL